MSDCPRLGKLLGGCKFSPRHDVNEVPEIILMRIDGGDVERLRSRSTYVHDICERCGKVVKR